MDIICCQNRLKLRSSFWLSEVNQVLKTPAADTRGCFSHISSPAARQHHMNTYRNSFNNSDTSRAQEKACRPALIAVRVDPAEGQQLCMSRLTAVSAPASVQGERRVRGSVSIT